MRTQDDDVPDLEVISDLEEAARQLWDEGFDLEHLQQEEMIRGDFSSLLRPHRQSDLYHSLHEHTESFPNSFGPLVFNTHRRLGKSFALNLYCFERNTRYPGQICRFGAPTLVQGRDYLFDIHAILQQLVPEIIWPKKSGDSWKFWSPAWKEGSQHSLMVLRGVMAAKGLPGDSMRGGRCNVAVLDEVREMERVDYIVHSILSYQFDKQFKPLLVLSTTPPESMAHEYVTYFIPKAKEADRYFLYPAEDTEDAEGNRDYTPDDKKRILEQIDEGEDSIAYKREALCALISDPEALIVREFSETKEKVIVEDDRVPPYFVGYVGIDWGYQDYTGGVFGHLDFHRQKLKITHEVFIHNAATRVIAAEFDAAELAAWKAPTPERARYVDHTGRLWLYSELLRVGDHDPQQIADMALEHDYAITAADKYDLFSNVGLLRSGFRHGRIEIHKRCVHLIQQLEHGIWKVSADGARREFLRNAALGHCDCLAALVYLYKKVDFSHDPFPVVKTDGNVWVEDREEQVLKAPARPLEHVRDLRVLRRETLR